MMLLGCRRMESAIPLCVDFDLDVQIMCNKTSYPCGTCKWTTSLTNYHIWHVGTIGSLCLIASSDLIYWIALLPLKYTSCVKKF